MRFKLLQIALVVAIGLYLVPTGAHLFEMPAKMALAPSDYMVVQHLYDGWQAFGFVAAIALALAFFHAYLVRTVPAALVAAILAFLAIAAALADFLMFTLPVNVATSSWTVMPVQFEAARRQWEYSHAAAAALTFAGLIASLASILRSGKGP